MYLLIFCCRYLDLFFYYFSFYNSAMKVFYLVSSISVISAIRKQSTYDATLDTLRHWHVAVRPALVMAVLTFACGNSHQPTHTLALAELLWTFSIYLEALAVIPQLIVFQRYRNIDFSLRNYIFSLGAYRALYVLNWIHRAHVERGYRHHWVVYGCGVVQTLFYVDFAVFYYRQKARRDMEMITYRLFSRFCEDADEDEDGRPSASGRGAATTSPSLSLSSSPSGGHDDDEGDAYRLLSEDRGDTSAATHETEEAASDDEGVTDNNILIV